MRKHLTFNNLSTENYRQQTELLSWMNQSTFVSINFYKPEARHHGWSFPLGTLVISSGKDSLSKVT